MYNIVKAQMYQAIRDNGTYYTFLGAIMGFVLIIIGASEDGIDFFKLTGSESIIDLSAGIIIILLALVFTVRICGSDISDKTINNEMLTGINRTKVYAGRIMVSLFFVLLCYILFTVLPVLIFSAVNGWGYTIPLKEAVLRLLLKIIPITRYVCLIGSITFVTLNPLAVVLIGFLLIIGEAFLLMITEEFAISIGNYLLPFLTMFQFNETEKYNFTFGYIDGKDVQVMANGMPSETIATIVISGIIAIVLYFVIGCAVFKKKDMN